MSDYILVHHGIKGQRWGVRRFQNADGSLTPAGRKRLNKKFVKSYNEAVGEFNNSIQRINKKYENKDTGSDPNKPFATKDGQKYAKEMRSEWNSTYVKHLKKNLPELFEFGEKWVDNSVPMMGLYDAYIRD